MTAPRPLILVLMTTVAGCTPSRPPSRAGSASTPSAEAPAPAADPTRAAEEPSESEAERAKAEVAEPGDRPENAMFASIEDGIAVRSTEGPFADADAICKMLTDDDQFLPCGTAYASTRRVASVPEITGLKVLVVGDISSDASLALQTSAGWFVAQRFEHVDGSVHGDYDSTFNVVAIKPVKLDEGGRSQFELVFKTTTKYGPMSGETVSSRRRKGSVICGVGPSGTPSCTTAIPRALDADEHNDQRIGLTRVLPGDGTLELKLRRASDAAKLVEGVPKVVGRHRIAFP